MIYWQLISDVPICPIDNRTGYVGAENGWTSSQTLQKCRKNIFFCGSQEAIVVSWLNIKYIFFYVFVHFIKMDMFSSTAYASPHKHQGYRGRKEGGWMNGWIDCVPCCP